MKLVGYAKNSEELKNLVTAGASEVYLGHQALSRLGTLTSTEIESLAQEARNHDLRPILEWDILMTEVPFAEAVATLRCLDLALFASIRVQDPGAIEYVLTNIPTHSVQLVLETGNHNMAGIKRWCEYGSQFDGGKRVERIAISNQLTKTKIAEIVASLPVTLPVEVLGIGPILLLYTPRHLLTDALPPSGTCNVTGNCNAVTGEDTSFLEATASSERNAHGGFRVIENTRGTFLFHEKDYCLIDQVAELREIGVGVFRADFRLEAENSRILEVSKILFASEPSAEAALALIASHPHKVTRSFFRANATDAVFKKLKNAIIQRKDEGFIGEVVEIQRDSHVIVHVLSKNLALQKGATLRFINPEGDSKEYLVRELKNLDQFDVDSVSQGDFAVLPYIKSVPPKTVVYL